MHWGAGVVSVGRSGKIVSKGRIVCSVPIVSELECSPGGLIEWGGDIGVELEWRTKKRILSCPRTSGNEADQRNHQWD